jgi:hypothetical protein
MENTVPNHHDVRTGRIAQVKRNIRDGYDEAVEEIAADRLFMRAQAELDEAGDRLEFEERQERFEGE